MFMVKILMTKEGRKFYAESGKDFHCQYGFVKAKDLRKKDGSKVISNTNKEFTIFTPGFIDLYRRIKRGAQIVSLKDIGQIIAITGIGKNSVVVDAGAGSGALACFLAHLAKKVITYDIRDDFIEIVRKNKEFLSLKNLTIKNKNIYEGIDEKNVDLITLDLPEPWMAIDSCEKALKPGGFLVSYSPSIPQVTDFVNGIRKNKNFVYLKTMELIQREWEVEERRVRPMTQGIGHTGFLVFVRRV